MTTPTLSQLGEMTDEELNVRRMPVEAFSITITEEDRQKAENFYCSQLCLIAHALRRHFDVFDLDATGPHGSINGVKFRFDPPIRYREVHALPWEETPSAPFYKPEVVGKTFTFTPLTP